MSKRDKLPLRIDDRKRIAKTREVWLRRISGRSIDVNGAFVKLAKLRADNPRQCIAVPWRRHKKCVKSDASGEERMQFRVVKTQFLPGLAWGGETPPSMQARGVRLALVEGAQTIS